MVAHAYNPSTQGTRWEDHEFSASLSYKANPSLKQLQPQNNVKNKKNSLPNKSDICPVSGYKSSGLPAEEKDPCVLQ